MGKKILLAVVVLFFVVSFGSLAAVATTSYIQNISVRDIQSSGTSLGYFSPTQVYQWNFRKGARFSSDKRTLLTDGIYAASPSPSPVAGQGCGQPGQEVTAGPQGGRGAATYVCCTGNGPQNSTWIAGYCH